MSFDHDTARVGLDMTAICAFLYREARLLDDRQWDDWLSCYAPDVTYWMPAWDDNDQTTEDPQSEISLMFYPNREGLEDRVFRIKTERSGASTPTGCRVVRCCNWTTCGSVRRHLNSTVPSSHSTCSRRCSAGARSASSGSVVSGSTSIGPRPGPWPIC